MAGGRQWSFCLNEGGALENMSHDRRCFVLVASGRDDRYLELGTLTAIRSIRMTNPGIPIVVLHHDLTADQQRLFAGTSLKRIQPVDFRFSTWSKISRPDMPDVCFLSLFVESIEEFDVAVYLDADAVVLEPLDELFELDVPLAARVMDDHLLAEHFEDGVGLLERENIGPGYALNNGIVRFDLRHWRSHSLLKEARDLYARHGADAFRYSDQSVLNLVAYKTGTLTRLPRTYNFSRHPDMLRMEHTLLRNSLGFTAPVIAEGIVKVVHWTGPLKPWSPDVADVDDRQVALCLECYEQFLA
jgi:lipopolysaccharide biosynthesis glycosyltransferase